MEHHRAVARRRVGIRQFVRSAVRVRVRRLSIPAVRSLQPLYLKLTAGLVHGYTGQHQNSIPLKQFGTAPAILPTLAIGLNRFCSELVVYGVLDTGHSRIHRSLACGNDPLSADSRCRRMSNEQQRLENVDDCFGPGLATSGFVQQIAKQWCGEGPYRSTCRLD